MNDLVDKPAGTALHAPDLGALLAAAEEAAGLTPEPTEHTPFDGVFGVGDSALLFVGRFRDIDGRPVFRGIVLDRWAPKLVGGRQELIPPLVFYHDHQGLLYRCALSYFKNIPLALHGHTGVGKTELVRYFAALLGVPVYRMNLHGLSTTDDIVGKLLPVGEGRVGFQEAWSRPRCGTAASSSSKR